VTPIGAVRPDQAAIFRATAIGVDEGHAKNTTRRERFGPQKAPAQL